MTATLEFDAAQFTKEVLRLILATAEQMKCTPQEALNHLLTVLATDNGLEPAKAA